MAEADDAAGRWTDAVALKCLSDREAWLKECWMRGVAALPGDRVVHLLRCHVRGDHQLPFGGVQTVSERAFQASAEVSVSSDTGHSSTAPLGGAKQHKHLSSEP